MPRLNVGFGLVAWLCVLHVFRIGYVQGQTVWPKPQSQQTSGLFYTLDSRTFRFSATGVNSALLEQALRRYERLVFYVGPSQNGAKTELQSLNGLDVFVVSGDESLEGDESYTLNVSPPVAQLRANTVYGAMRGLETFSQLVTHTAGVYQVEGTTISDFPRFSFRGVLIDTSRHYLGLSVILRMLDAMAYSKFNVLHWHIVDDQSFPYVSHTFPLLSLKGSYNPITHVYSRQDVKRVIEYAKERGIRVVAEFDTPGHTESWGKGYPQLLTPCYTGNKVTSYYAINPILNSTWDFLTKFFQEVASVFPDRYVHVGGDELDFSCWQSNPQVRGFMQQHGFRTYSELEQYYENKLLEIVASTKKSYIVWEDVFDNGVKVLPDTVVHVWRDKWQTTIAKSTAAGYRSLLSSPWYLNYISYGNDWRNYYEVEPLNFNGTAQQKKLVMGGATTFWGEYIDGSNLLSRAWPRSCAIAERLWSAESVRSLNDAEARLHVHRCRLVRRGIPAEPASGPSFCDQEWVHV